MTADMVLVYVAARAQEKEAMLTLFRPNGQFYFENEVKNIAHHEEAETAYEHSTDEWLNTYPNHPLFEDLLV